jgi:hypothetical protein
LAALQLLNFSSPLVVFAFDLGFGQPLAVFAHSRLSVFVVATVWLGVSAINGVKTISNIEIDFSIFILCKKAGRFE